MKKIISSLVVLGLSTTILMGCGKYEPTIAENGVMYKATQEKEQDGSYPVINIKSVTKNGDKIIVQTESPIEQMLYAYKNFICFQTIDADGEKDSKINVKVEEVDEQGKFILTPEGMKMEDVKYLEVGPYKDGDNFLIYEVK
ncbi:hypothetical protein M4I33_16445 [Clostridium sp. LY3-2]|uniref:hypothetical protein n=1 Tax=Clostridium sp. LY3-2 TaxID=2942482 RepID=UPI00215327E4|nr:hypothetical protein [Clostridium sp. LY3-2]MCR6516447.1 hypothetical protein [Clostridium sp. LY3-2]